MKSQNASVDWLFEGQPTTGSDELVPPPSPPSLPSRLRTGGRPLAQREPRYEAYVPALFGEGVSLDARGITGNVSRKGLELRGHTPLAIGTHVSFVLRLQNKAFVRGVGEVMWSRSVASGAVLGLAVLVADPAYWTFLDELEA